jgi:hypothetical protein
MLKYLALYHRILDYLTLDSHPRLSPPQLSLTLAPFTFSPLKPHSSSTLSLRFHSIISPLHSTPPSPLYNTQPNHTLPFTLTLIRDLAPLQSHSSDLLLIQHTTYNIQYTIHNTQYATMQYFLSYYYIHIHIHTHTHTHIYCSTISCPLYVNSESKAALLCSVLCFILDA